jgi:hypothetical protein
VFERSLRKVVRDRERLALLEPGGAAEHPIVVTSASVIEVRVAATPCIQCDGEYRLVEHEAPGAGLRACHVTCRQCGVSRTLWFKIAPPVDDAN